MSLFDEGEDVTEVENSARHAIGVEGFEIVEGFARRRENDRSVRETAHGERRTTTGVAVEFGEHNPREVDPVLESLCRRDGVLTDHRVENKQHFIGARRIANRARFAHKVFVDAQPAGRVNDDRVELLLLREFDAVFRNGDGVALSVARLGRKDCHASLFGHNGQLSDGVGALQVTRDEHWGVPLGLEVTPQLSREGRFSRTLEAREHDDRRRGFGELQLGRFASQDSDEFVVDNLNDLLGRIESFVDIVRQRALANRRREILDDLEGDVCFEERPANLTDGSVNVRRAQLAFRAQR